MKKIYHIALNILPKKINIILSILLNIINVLLININYYYLSISIHH